MIKFIDVWKAFRMNKNGGLFVTLIQVMGRAIPFQVFGWVSKCKSANTKTEQPNKYIILIWIMQDFLHFPPKIETIFDNFWSLLKNHTEYQNPNPTRSKPKFCLPTPITNTNDINHTFAHNKWAFISRGSLRIFVRNWHKVFVRLQLIDFICPWSLNVSGDFNKKQKQTFPRCLKKCILYFISSFQKI